MRSVVSLRLRAVAGLLTLLSGGLMMLAGYLGHEASWSTAGWVTLPAGVVILAALLVARQAVSTAGETPTHRARGAGTAVTAATMTSGGVMVLAGYAGPAWGWPQALLLAAVGGGVITLAFIADRA